MGAAKLSSTLRREATGQWEAGLMEEEGAPPVSPYLSAQILLLGERASMLLTRLSLLGFESNLAVTQ